MKINTIISLIVAAMSFLTIACTEIKKQQQIKSVSLSPDNICTFHIADRLFSLIYLEKVEPYEIKMSQNKKILFNFCSAFLPRECTNAQNSTVDEQKLQGFAFVVTKNQQDQFDEQNNQTTQKTSYLCERYTSDSYISYFGTQYVKHRDEPQLILNLTTPNASNKKHAEFRIFCSEEEYYKIEKYQLENNNNTLQIYGQSVYGCPVFQISSLWTTLQSHSIILGIIMFVLGFQMLFFGLLMINITIFIAGYFISFALLAGIFTVFLGPNSSSIAVYFSLLFILLASTLIAYGLTKLIDISIFFIGAFFGLIVGALVNTLFSQLFSVYSVWSLVIFQILFIVPFGLLTFKYSNEIIILSTSLTGSYMMIRPISWLLGGFPNQFVLYQMYQSYELSSLPWSFYLYLLVIIALAIMGALYQILKLQKQDPNNTVHMNIVTQTIQSPVDKIKAAVDKIIQRYSSSDNGQDQYRRYKEMDHPKRDYLVEQSEVPSNYDAIDKDKKEKRNNSGKIDDDFF